MSVLLGSIYAVAFARNDPILPHPENPARGYFRRLKPKDILDVND